MISVLACTNRRNFVKNIIHNFQKQTLEEKELLLILNSSEMKEEEIKELLEKLKIRYRLLQYPEGMSLGECLNKSAALASYDYIAKMDDDDYYGTDFLDEAFQGLIQTKADVVGKSTFYIYFHPNKELRLYNPNHENRQILKNGQSPYKSSYFLSGASLVFRKEILKKVAFPHLNLGEDSGFQRQCYESGMKLYSLSKEYYAYQRYSEPSHHNSDASEFVLRRNSQFITSTPDLEKFMER
ncbi:glycosyltransferase [Neobacillus pocheonensis]|uniref:glycosyltransferase family 2 protein n=1 Tax=Neobacillus pocheonensis TaxID=363869 RepID=UPI003D29E7C4